MKAKKKPEPKKVAPPKKSWADLNPDEQRTLIKKASDDINARNVLNLIRRSNAGKVLTDAEIEKVNDYVNREKEQGGFSMTGIETATVYAGDLAKILGITERRIQQLKNEGVMQKVSHGRYRLVQSVHEYVKYLQSRAGRASKGGHGGIEERIRKTEAEAALLEIKLKESRGTLVRVEEVGKEWQKILVVIRQNLLTLPTKIPPFIEGCKSKTEMRDVIEKYLHEAMDAISQGEIPEHRSEGFGGELPKDSAPIVPDPTATTETQSERVGGPQEDSNV